MKTNKQFSFVAILLMLTSCLILAGCSDVTAGRPANEPNEIPSDLRNTAWVKQISGTETVTISFGMNRMIMSSNVDPSQYNQQWEYRGGYCCGYGYCGFYNGPNEWDFRYKSSNGALTISGSNVRSLNGNWTRK